MGALQKGRPESSNCADNCVYIYIYIISYTISYTIYIKRDNESAHKKGEKLDLAASDRNALFFNKLDLVRCVLV